MLVPLSIWPIQSYSNNNDRWVLSNICNFALFPIAIYRYRIEKVIIIRIARQKQRYKKLLQKINKDGIVKTKSMAKLKSLIVILLKQY